MLSVADIEAIGCSSTCEPIKSNTKGTRKATKKKKVLAKTMKALAKKKKKVLATPPRTLASTPAASPPPTQTMKVMAKKQKKKTMLATPPRVAASTPAATPPPSLASTPAATPPPTPPPPVASTEPMSADKKKQNKNIYSKAYHTARSAAESAGISDDECRVIGRKAGKTAVLESYANAD